MEKKNTRRKEGGFQSWWNQVFWTKRPYYQSYRALYYTGANLDYIRFLHNHLEVGDAIQSIDREKPEGAETKGRKQKFELPPALREKLVSLAMEYARGFTEGALERATELNPADPWLSLPLLRPLSPPLFPPLTPPGQLISAHLKQFNQEVVERAWNYLEEWLRKKQEEELRKRAEEFESFAKQNPMARVLKEYLPLAGNRKTGRRSDVWGSFFLLAVTEHLRKKSRSKRPALYLLAARLLRSARGRPFKSSYQERTNAKALVRKLKKSHPKKWKSDLKILEREFSRVRSVMHRA